MDIVAEANKYKDKWQNKDDYYWLSRLQQEMAELTLVLDNQHKDTLEHELIQIATISINWLRKRGNNIEGP